MDFEKLVEAAEALIGKYYPLVLEAEADRKKNPAMSVEAGRYRLSHGDLVGAYNDLLAATRLDPRNIPAIKGIISIYTKSPGTVVSQAYVERAMGRLAQLAPEDSLSLCLRAGEMESSGNRQEAENLYERARKTYRYGEEAFFVSAFCLMDHYYRKADDKTFFPFCNEVLKIDPSIARAWEEMGDFHFARSYDDYDVAREAYTKVVILNPGSVSGWRALCAIDSYLGRSLFAKLTCGTAVRLSPREPFLYLSLSYSAASEGDLKNQEVHLLAALGVAPDDPNILAELALFYAKTGRVFEAVLTVRQALDKMADPESRSVIVESFTSQLIKNKLAPIVAGTGWTYTGDSEVVAKWEEMRQLAGLVLEIDPANPYALYLRARTAWRLSVYKKEDGERLADQAVADLTCAEKSKAGHVFKRLASLELGLACMRKFGQLFNSRKKETPAEETARLSEARRFRELAEERFAALADEALQKDGTPDLSSRLVVEAQLSLGWLYYEAREYDSAEKSFKVIAEGSGRWSTYPVSPKERAEAFRAMGLAKYKSGRDLFAKGSFDTALQSFRQAIVFFEKAGTYEKAERPDPVNAGSGAHDEEKAMLDAQNSYLATIFPEEPADTIMNEGFAQHFAGRSLDEKPGATEDDRQKAVVHFNFAVGFFGRILDKAPHNPEALRWRGSAKIGAGHYASGVQDLMDSLEYKTSEPDNSRRKIVMAVRRMLEMARTDPNSDGVIKEIILIDFPKAGICKNPSPEVANDVFGLADLLKSHPRCGFFSGAIIACLRQIGTRQAHQKIAEITAINACSGAK